jgi:hypothetical protein
MFRLTMFVLCIVLLSACGAPQKPAPTPASPAGDQPSSSTNIQYPSPSDSDYPSPVDDPYAPQPGDDALKRAEFQLDKSATKILQAESFPLQFTIALKGFLPTACHQLRVVINPPDDNNKIVVEVYTLADPNKVCAEMTKSFEGSIPLGSFDKGHYTVFINDVMIGEIDA